MHPLAHHVPALALILTLTTLGYLARAVTRPFKTCRHCAGYGRTPARTGRARPRPCRRCNGHGIRPRAWRRTARASRRILDDSRDGGTPW